VFPRLGTTLLKDRRLGFVGIKTAGSALELPLVPPNSPTPLDGDNNIFTDNPSSHSTLIHDAATAVANLQNPTLVFPPGCEDPLPVPVDTSDTHDVCTKNGKTLQVKTKWRRRMLMMRLTIRL